MALHRTSVIVPVFRGWEHAGPLVDDLAVQQPAEIVVVDDASGDGQGPPFAARRQYVTLVTREENGGFAAAVNDGIERSTGDVVAVLNSDVELGETDLRELVSLAVRTGGIVGPRTIDAHGQIAPTARLWQTIPRMLAEFFVPLRLLPRLDQYLRDIDSVALRSREPVSTDWLVGSCLVFPRHVWESVGPLDTRFHMNSEEVDWQWRAAREGLPRTYVPAVTVTHLGGRSTVNGEERFLAVWRARAAFVQKHRGQGGLGALRLGLLVALAAMTPFLVVALMVPARRRWAQRTLRLHARALYQVLAYAGAGDARGS